MSIDTERDPISEIDEIRQALEDLDKRVPKTNFFRRMGNPMTWQNPLATPSFAITSRMLGPGSVTATALAVTLSGLVDVVTSLPALPNTAYPQGKVVFLTSDMKLYRNTDGNTWSRSIDGGLDILADTITAGAIAAGAIGASEIAANAVTATAIAAAAITATKMNIVLILLVGATWTDNSPGAGSIAWSGVTVYYNGTAYAITNSNTANEFIWWSSTSSNTTFQSSNTRPALLDNEFMIATNNGGLHDLVWNTTAPADLSVNPAHLNFESMASLFIYGDGIDGDVTISGDTTLTRDMAYNNLTINSTKVLTPDGYRIFVKNTLTNNGTIRANGPNASGPTAGVGLTGHNMGGSSSGGTAGINNGGGNDGSSLTNGLGGIGGISGTTPNWPTPTNGGPMTTSVANRHGLVLLSTSAEVRGGTGGGGGGSGLTGGAAGGGGGAGGGVIIIAARTITNNGTIEAKGGAGGNASAGTSQGAGGGGGAGGAVVLVYRAITVGTISVAGGALGTGAGTSGTNGVAGATGLALQIQQEA